MVFPLVWNVLFKFSPQEFGIQSLKAFAASPGGFAEQVLVRLWAVSSLG